MSRFDDAMRDGLAAYASRFEIGSPDLVMVRAAARRRQRRNRALTSVATALAVVGARGGRRSWLGDPRPAPGGGGDDRISRAADGRFLTASGDGGLAVAAVVAGDPLAAAPAAFHEGGITLRVLDLQGTTEIVDDATGEVIYRARPRASVALASGCRRWPVRRSSYPRPRSFLRPVST